MRRHALEVLTAVSGMMWASVASAAPTVTVTTPAASAPVDDTMSIYGTYTSSSVVSKVHAVAGTAAADLAFNSANFSGSLDLSAVPIGPLTLTVTVTDALSATGTAQVAIVHDHAPTVSVATLPLTVARPTIRLQATCADADAYPCASVTASVGGAVLATSTGPLDQTVSLAAYDGKQITIDFVAKDTAGLSGKQSIVAFVDSGPELIEEEATSGPVLDFDATRVLFVGPTGPVLRQRSPRVDTVVGSGAPASGYLTPLGAIWPGGEWRSGVAKTNTAVDLRANGQYAAWASGSTLVVRDVVADTTTSVPVASTSSEMGDVAPNGDVVFDGDKSQLHSEVYRYRSSAVTQVSQDSGQQFFDGVTDGTNVVYRQKTIGALPHPPVIVYTAKNEYVYLPVGYGTYGEPSHSGTDYAARDGWVSFTTIPDQMSGLRYVQSRAPDGTVAIVSPFTTDTTIAAMAPNGVVAYTTAGTRYFGSAAAPKPVHLTTHALGRIVWKNDTWYAVIGRSLFRIDPSVLGGVADAGADTGAADAGAEAGTPDSGSGDASTTDASTTDAGGTEIDAGGTDMDAGTTPDADVPDAGGGGGSDASVPPGSGDAGGGSGGVPGDDGGGCDLAGHPASSGVGSWAALGLALLLGRRRARRPR